jgi:hypothetical protein
VDVMRAVLAPPQHLLQYPALSRIPTKEEEPCTSI